jgi:hypothetical protein
LTFKFTDSTTVSDPNVYGDTPPQLTVETFSYDGAGRMLTAVKDFNDVEIKLGLESTIRSRGRPRKEG